MATTIYPTVPVARSEAEQWPVDDDPIGVQGDEMIARQLDTARARSAPSCMLIEGHSCFTLLRLLLS